VDSDRAGEALSGSERKFYFRQSHRKARIESVLRAMLKQFVKHMITRAVFGLSKTSVGRYAYQQIIDTSMKRERVVNYRSHRMVFAVPNWLNQYRVDTFATKEPETLEWIESIPEGAVFWDVGANIGLYSIYAAKARNCRVYAFEPSVFNLELLARNIYFNNLQSQITIIPVALSDQLGLNLFKMSTTAWGGALSTFGQDFDQNGAPLKDIFEYQTLGLSITDMVSLLYIPQPDYIKIDVDGIEHFILRGGGNVLAKVKGVLIEINDNSPEQAEESARLLESAGLSLHKKCDLGVPNHCNQWWQRAVT
jgi:FkbM family methyltransferase